MRSNPTDGTTGELCPRGGYCPTGKEWSQVERLSIPLNSCPGKCFLVDTIKYLSKYSQTCLKGPPKGRTKSGYLRQVTP